MKHLFILCGPPACGKTTLLKMIRNSRLKLRQIPRLTTRASRKEEGDSGKQSLEYKFLSPAEFAIRISRCSAANLIEWNGSYYATETDPIDNALEKGDCLIYEDIPGSLDLKRHFGSNATVILLFTEDKEALLNLEFGDIEKSGGKSVEEWVRRLKQKYRASLRGERFSENGQNEYIKMKMKRAIPDLAYIAGKIRAGEDILVLANKKDAQKTTFASFRKIVKSVAENTVTKENPGKFAFVLMPFKDEFDKIYQFVIKPVIEKEGLTCVRGDEIFGDPVILDDIRDRIDSSNLIIADITNGNPNVFLELGMTMEKRKNFILLSQDDKNPFDVQAYRWIKYENTLKGWKSLSSDITDLIRKIKKREIKV